MFHQRDGSPHADFFALLPYHVGGTFGNALFDDRNVIVIDRAHRRFGVAPSP